jgi:hypothetical protein
LWVYIAVPILDYSDGRQSIIRKAGKPYASNLMNAVVVW